MKTVAAGVFAAGLTICLTLSLTAEVFAQAETSKEGFVVVPVSESNALVFPPDQAVELTCKVRNDTLDELRLTAAVRAFRGVKVQGKPPESETTGPTVVNFGVRQAYRLETLPDKTVAEGQAAVEARTDAAVRVPLGPMPEGFYMVDLVLHRGDEQLARGTWPLGVFPPPAGDGNLARPDFPIGVYTKLMNYRRSQPDIFWKTYVHAVAHSLRKHHVNTILAAGRFAEGELEIYNRYGIVGLSRFGHDLDHPGIIGSFISDEPKPGPKLEKLKKQYEALQERTEKIITTCMIGEDMGMTTPQDPIKLWQHLQPNVRVFRWYGIKKSFYGVLHHVHYKGMLPYTSVLRLAEVSDKTPWWIVLPSFGGLQHEAYYQNPTPAQMRSMAHLACAYGADGIVYYLYQTGLVDPVTLQPLDGKLAAIGEVAGLFEAHAKKLQTLEHAGVDIRCPSPVVQAVPLKVAKQAAVYAVNRDPNNAVSTRLMLWDDVWHWSTATDIYADRQLEVQKDDDGYLFVAIELVPGEGKLILTDARIDRK